MSKFDFSRSYMSFNILFVFVILFSFSCQEQIDELWENDDEAQSLDPLIGDWYADSIISYSNCIKSPDNSDYDITELLGDRSIENYNLWLLSDGSLQLAFDQSINLSYECNTYYDTWNNETGCGDYSPLEFCNGWYEHNQYNIETTDCSQSAVIEGTWSSDENNSTITLNMNSVCVNGWGNPSYLSSASSCNSLDESEFYETFEKTFTYDVDLENSVISMEGSWFDDDESCVNFYMSAQ